MNEKQHEHQNDIKEIKMKNEFLTKKFEEMDRAIKVDLNLRGTLADLKKRIHNMLEMMSGNLSLQNEKFNVLHREKNIFVTVKDSLTQEIKNFNDILSNFKHQLSEEIIDTENKLNIKIQNLNTDVSQVESENCTVKALVKKQMEEFTQIFYQLEMNKIGIDRLNSRVDTLPVYEDLEDTDNYILKYFPIKIQKMIDDTLFQCLGSAELKKLMEFEKKIFATLESNVKTIHNKLQKKQYDIPSSDLRKHTLKQRQSSLLTKFKEFKSFESQPTGVKFEEGVEKIDEETANKGDTFRKSIRKKTMRNQTESPKKEMLEDDDDIMGQDKMTINMYTSKNKLDVQMNKTGQNFAKNIDEMSEEQSLADDKNQLSIAGQSQHSRRKQPRIQGKIVTQKFVYDEDAAETIDQQQLDFLNQLGSMPSKVDPKLSNIQKDIKDELRLEIRVLVNSPQIKMKLRPSFKAQNKPTTIRSQQYGNNVQNNNYGYVNRQLNNSDAKYATQGNFQLDNNNLTQQFSQQSPPQYPQNVLQNQAYSPHRFQSQAYQQTGQYPIQQQQQQLNLNMQRVELDQQKMILIQNQQQTLDQQPQLSSRQYLMNTERQQDFVNQIGLLSNRLNELTISQNANNVGGEANNAIKDNDTLNTVDIFKDIQNQIQALYDRINSVQTSVVLFKNDIIQEQDNFVASTHARFKTEKAEMDHKIEEIKSEFKEEVKRRKREKAEMQSEFSIVLRKFDKGKENIDKSIKQNQAVLKIISALIKTMKMQQALDLQDDIDRESIFLMGCKDIDQSQKAIVLDQSLTLGQKLPHIQSNSYSSKKMSKFGLSTQPNSPQASSSMLNNNQQVMSLDKNCLTCSQGGIPMALSAFKIACITYMPSQVAFENALVPRRQLIEMKGQLIQICDQSCQDYDFSMIDKEIKNIVIQLAQYSQKSNGKTFILPHPRRSSQYGGGSAGGNFLAAQSEYSFQQQDQHKESSGALIGYSKSKELKQRNNQFKHELDQQMNSQMSSVYENRTRQYSRRGMASKFKLDTQNNNQKHDISIMNQTAGALNGNDPLNMSVDDVRILQIDGNNCLLVNKEEELKQLIRSQATSPTNNKIQFGQNMNAQVNHQEFTTAINCGGLPKINRQSLGSKDFNRIKVYNRNQQVFD
eukprot:403367156